MVVCCAPLFEERFALNEQCVRQGKPMVDCAMYELTGQVTTILPGTTACLACRVPGGAGRAGGVSSRCSERCPGQSAASGRWKRSS